MIKATFGIEREPFNRTGLDLFPQQSQIANIIKIHSQHGGFSVVIGAPGVGKTVVREHLENLANERDTVVVSCSRTLHTYLNIIRQLADSFQVEAAVKDLEKTLIQTAFDQVRQRKTLYTLIDEAHLLDMGVLRKLRLLFEQFPKKHNLVLFGQRDLLVYLSMNIHADIKSRITYSEQLLPLTDEGLEAYIQGELDAVRLGANTFDDGAIELIIRSVQGNLRLCRNLCYGSLVEACRINQKIVSIRHVNNVLIQPHWRSQEALIKQQVDGESVQHKAVDF
ncbi:MAG: AAA family ATPase [Sedimenticola sp.]